MTRFYTVEQTERDISSLLQNFYYQPITFEERYITRATCVRQTASVHLFMTIFFMNF